MFVKKVIRPLVFIYLIMFCHLFARTTHAAEPTYSDVMVRVAVVFGILRFTEWPHAKDNDVINLCSYGQSPSATGLSRLPKFPSIGKKEVVYRSLKTNSNISDCHAIIMGSKVSMPTPQLIATEPALLICDECGPSDYDRSAVLLMLKDKRIQFSVNLDRALDQKVNLNASLIELAASCTSSNPDIRGCNE